MPNFQAITSEGFASKTWQRYSSYAFTSKEALVPLVAAELPKAAMSLPVAFIEQGESVVPAVVLSYQPEQNLFVAPDGRWLGSYIPSLFRSYPFRLANTEDGQQVLCIDEDSGLVTDGPAGEAFFTEEGKPAQGVLEILNFLTQIEQNRVATATACAILKKHNLIQPWPVSVQTETIELKMAGLFRIDEAALNQLSAEALHEVAQSGGLLIAYCQLLSMQHLQVLGQLAQAHSKAAQKPSLPVAGGDLNLEFLNQGGNISFGSFA